jgi:membrane-associated protein
MKQVFSFLFFILLFGNAYAQDSINIVLKNQYQSDVKNKEVNINGHVYTSSKDGLLTVAPADTLLVSLAGYTDARVAMTSIDANKVVTVKKKFTWTDLLTPMFYIVLGGLWFIVFIIFAETGLFAGFFLPGDSLLFVTGIFSNELLHAGTGIDTQNSFINLLLLGVIISIAGILGNFTGYWFGRKSGPFLFERKDTFFFKKKYLFQARDFYDKHGGGAIVMARFLPIVRTFAPIIAGIVSMDKKKFTFYNIVGCVAWVLTMLIAGHYLQQLFLKKFNFDLRDHLEVIVIGIVLVTTAPVIIKIFFGKKKPKDETSSTAR